MFNDILRGDWRQATACSNHRTSLTVNAVNGHVFARTDSLPFIASMKRPLSRLTVFTKIGLV